MKNSVIAALVSAVLFAGPALAGDGPLVTRKVRGSVIQSRDLVPNLTTDWSGPYGIHNTDGTGGATVVRAGIYIRQSRGCPKWEQGAAEAWASPDLYPALKGRTIMVPTMPMQFIEVDIVGENDSGDEFMLYMCIPDGPDAEEWAESVSILK